MKKTILLALATLFATVTFAQQQLATLNHNDSITVYYGIDALVSAHNAAVNGDIITLSSGIFNGTEVTKIVKIRGAGMWTNDSLGIQNTVINGITTFSTPNDTLYSASVEGLLFNNDVRYGINASNVTFIKCRIIRFGPGINNAQLFRFQFINCIITDYNLATYINQSWASSTDSCISFINSIVLNDFTSKSATLLNSIIHISPSFNKLSKLNVRNSIVHYDYHNHSGNYGYYCLSGDDYNAATCYYSIGCNANTYNSHPYAPNDCHYFDITNAQGHNLYNKRGLNSVFKSFNGTYTEGMSFELQDNIANTILGDDSTQVGIYGGMYPFDPNVRNPLIRRCNVANRSTADGKLAVDIEVVSE